MQCRRQFICLFANAPAARVIRLQELQVLSYSSLKMH